MVGPSNCLRTAHQPTASAMTMHPRTTLTLFHAVVSNRCDSVGRSLTRRENLLVHRRSIDRKDVREADEDANGRDPKRSPGVAEVSEVTQLEVTLRKLPVSAGEDQHCRRNGV